MLECWMICCSMLVVNSPSMPTFSFAFEWGFPLAGSFYIPVPYTVVFLWPSWQLSARRAVCELHSDSPAAAPPPAPAPAPAPATTTLQRITLRPPNQYKWCVDVLALALGCTIHPPSASLLYGWVSLAKPAYYTYTYALSSWQIPRWQQVRFSFHQFY